MTKPQKAAIAPDPTVRIHRLFDPSQPLGLPGPTGETFTGAIVDVETTGLDYKADKIIELAILTFQYDTTDRIVSVGHAYEGLQNPGRSLSPEITEITGLTDDDLAGKEIDWEIVRNLVDDPEGDPVRLFVAHNAGFDRPFVEAAGDKPFTKRAWACSYNEMHWRRLFPETTANSLGAVLAGTRREYYEAHRALDDCWAVLRVLSTPVEVLGAAPGERQAFTALIESARSTTRRVFADKAPFNLKDALKLGRKYSWQPDAKVWYLDITGPDIEASAKVAAEIAWLREHGVQARVEYFDAKDRWSTRV